MEIMTKALRGLLNRAKFAVEQNVFTIYVDAATVASIVHELLEFRDVFAEGEPAINRVHEYIQRYYVDFNLTTNDVVDTVLDDAERLRAELERLQAVIEQQTEEIGEREDTHDTQASQIAKLLFDRDALQAENAALQAALDTIYDRVVLSAKPDAAPVETAPAREIAVGDKVKIVKRSAYQDWYGTVAEINDKSTQPYVVLLSRFYGYEVEEYTRDEIEPA